MRAKERTNRASLDEEIEQCVDNNNPLTEEEKKHKDLISKPNFDPVDYPYSAGIPCSRIKKGMKIIDDGLDYDDVFYMYEVKKDAYPDTYEYCGKVFGCFVIEEIAFAKDGTILYDQYTKLTIEEDEDDEFTFLACFSSVEEAKSFGIEESQIEESDFSWVLAGFESLKK